MRRTVSLVLAVSFAATAITGLLMLITHVGVVEPAHKLMAVTFTIAAVFHIVLNAKLIGGYIKEKPMLAIILLALTAAIAAFMIIVYPHHEEGRHGRPFSRQSHNIDRD
ncbi:MAG: DUF4405 domain-containing protein [Armatimonadota bacterium]